MLRAYDRREGAVVWSYDAVRSYTGVNGLEGTGGAFGMGVARADTRPGFESGDGDGRGDLGGGCGCFDILVGWVDQNKAATRRRW